ncbi:MAG: PH domain-containing protein, partial [Oscillospiraceae bacterium]
MLHGRYHIFSTFKYIKYGLLLCLVPLLKALLVFNLNAFFVALSQDAFILVCIAVVSLCLWRSSRYTLTRLELCCENGILVKKITHFKLDTITAIEIKRSLVLRLLGGSDVYVYFKSSYPVKSLKICIPYKSAERLVDEILPVKSDKIHYQPSGWDKFIFVMLSANIVTTSFFVIYTVKRISKFLGMNVEQIAMQQLNHMEQIFSFLLPAGFTMLISIISFFVFISLAFSVFNAYGFSVARSRNIIISRGGFISKVERRLRLNCITYTDVHVSPFARLLKSYPVFVCAGGYKGNEMPLFVYKKGETANIRKILPEFTICSNLHLGGNLRYHFTFLWLPL